MMVRMILYGCNGAMGQVITHLVSEYADVQIAAGIDLNPERKNDYPVYGSLEACREEADVIVDFTSAAAADPLISYCDSKKIPLVCCSTGLSEEQNRKLKLCARKTAVLRSANMSLGVNLLLKLVKDAAKTLAEAGFDIEIVEKHHNRKLDAPSGTALSLADSINDAMDHRYHYQYDRSTRHEKRDKLEIGISAVRGGSIVGEHDVIFAGQDEVVTISHTAYSRAIFGKGAIEAARFLVGKPAGFYTMSDVIGA